MSAAGAALVVLVLRDIFHTLWHPSGRGALSRRLVRGVWALARRLPRRSSLRGLTGPLGMVLILLSWAGLVALGWFLVYLPHVPDGFSYDEGLDPQRRSAALDAAYLSLVTLGTLGYGDLVPQEPWLRVVAPLQALVGFVLLTAAVSWLLQVYPALARRRTLALQLTELRRAGTAETVARLDDAVAVGLLQPLLAQVSRVRVDLAQYDESYFFRDADDDACLALAGDYLFRLAGAASRAPGAGTRLVGELLRRSVDELAAVLLGQRLLRVGQPDDGTPPTTEQVLEAWAVDHGRRPGQK